MEVSAMPGRHTNARTHTHTHTHTHTDTHTYTHTHTHTHTPHNTPHAHTHRHTHTHTHTHTRPSCLFYLQCICIERDLLELLMHSGTEGFIVFAWCAWVSDVCFYT